MAELAIGLTKSVVEGALTKAQSAIEEEGKLRRGAQRDLVFITGEFQMMQSFLTVANEERVGNLVVMTWVRQIRELAFDVEDCIEFVVHLDKKSSNDWRRRVLRSFVPPCIPTAALPLDEAVDEIEQLKARVEDVSARNARYSLISDTGSKPVAAQQQSSAPSATAGGGGATALHLLLEERDAAKRPQGDLTQFIPRKDDNLQVISVWGSSGDLGTTSLIRKAYSDQEICTTFTSRAWVKLTHPFDPHDFVRCLMTQFYEETCRAQGAAAVGVHVLKKMKETEAEILEKFEQQVTKNRYLVVLEDVSSMVEWDAVRTFLPDMKNGSWTIVSTLQSEIARLCVGHPAQVLELRQFSAEHSVYAFFKEGTHSVRDKTEVTDKVSSSSNEISASTGLLSSPTQGGGGNLPPSSSNNRIIPDSASQWVKKNPLVGRNAEMKELREIVAMTGYNHHHVSISVWGIAGVGKSHLVRSLYYDTMINSQQFDQYSWVQVSRPFNLRDFTRGLLLGFESESPEAKETTYRHMMGSKNPIQECRALLKRRCLVVIDDLQTKEEWDLIWNNLVSPSNSVIIVITTDGSIATHCADNKEDVFNVKGLQADAASNLFNMEMHRKNKQPSVEQDHNNDIIQELIPKCGGLPKIIVDVARLLAKKTVRRMDTAQSINERFIHQLETNPEFNSLRDLFDWMHTYFRTCPYFLKPCIFYMSIFPQDHSIRRRRLVRRWIAEGYSRDGEENSAEDKGEQYFSRLLDLSIIQQPPPVVTTTLAETGKVFWQVNGFIREYIVSRRMEENLVSELGDSSTLTTQRTGRHLAIRKSWNRDKILFGSIDFSRLRSLTVFGEWKSFLISEDMKLLRVLDLEDAFGITDDDVEQMVKLLRRLKFLSLRNCRDIHHLPSSLGDLRQLQTLDVRHTSIATLPVSTTKLQKLQFIRAGTNIVAEDESARCPSLSWPLSTACRHRQLVGIKLPRGTDKLTALHTLGVINIGASGGKAILKGLKELTQLRKLGVSGINKKNSDGFFSAISGHAHLESLLVQLDKGNADCLNDIDISMHLKKIRSLKLYGSLDELPRGIDQLRMLTKLGLEMGTLKLSDLQLLGKLPELSVLRLNMEQVDNGKLHFCVTVYNVELCSYEKVRVLEITCNSVVHVTFGSLAMKNLEELKTDCIHPESSVTGLENLKKLRTRPALGPRL